MGYSFDHDESTLAGVRRVCLEQLDEAVDDLGPSFADEPHAAIHDVRKRCKKIRGAVRLVRPVVPSKQYRRVNDVARDAARELSGFRDARALVVTFERLRDATELDRDQLASTLELLVADQRVAEGELAPDHPALEAARDRLAQLGDAIDALPSANTEWGGIAPGLVKTYERGRSAMSSSIDRPTGPSIHEWRKRAKYTRYHLALVAPSAPDVLEPLEAAFHRLTDTLGDAHDLFVLEQRLEGIDDVDGARLLVNGARTDLERRAVHLGRRLYAESGKRFGQRLGTYWDIWRSEPAQAGGSLGGLDD